MENKHYKIELTGKTLNDTPLEVAVGDFAKIFKLPLDKAQQLFSTPPSVLKNNVDEITAKKYQQALKKANIAHRISVVPPTDSLSTGASQNSDIRADISHSTPSNQKPAAPAPTNTETAKTFENPDGLRFSLQGQPDYAFLTVYLPENETIKVEASSMATMDTHIKMRTKAKGGLGRLFTGESLFINEFTAEHAPGEIGIAPGTPGDIIHRRLEDNDTLFLQNSAFLASSPALNIETKLDIFKGIFSGAGLVLIKCSGPGDLWFNTYGAAIEVDVDGEYVVDTDKIIAWQEGLEYSVSKVGGYKSLFFSGEGFVCRFSGKGKLWVQTRSAKAFTSWAHWYRPVKKKG